MYCDFFTKYFRCCVSRENDTTSNSILEKKNNEWSGSWNSFPYTFDDMSKSTTSSSSSLSSLTSSSSEDEYRGKAGGLSHRIHIHNNSLFHPYDTR